MSLLSLLGLHQTANIFLNHGTDPSSEIYFIWTNVDLSVTCFVMVVQRICRTKHDYQASRSTSGSFNEMKSLEIGRKENE